MSEDSLTQKNSTEKVSSVVKSEETVSSDKSKFKIEKPDDMSSINHSNSSNNSEI